MTEQQTPEQTETIVVIGPHYWGKGSTLAEAKSNFRRYGGTLGNGYSILTFPPEVEFLGVNDMGVYRWTWRDPEAHKDEALPYPTEKEVAPKGARR